MKRLVGGGIAAVVIAAGVLLHYFGPEIRANERKVPRANPPVPVSVAEVHQKTVAFRIQAVGNVEAHATVALKARVEGQIIEVGFKEGEPVRSGQVLFRIDPRPFETALRQAEANHLRDTAQRDQTRSQERRYQELLQKNFVSKEAYAQIRTNAETSEAVALASKAALDNARLNLEYCTIRAPIEGYAGKIQIQMGNLVRPNDATPLVVINQVHPIYVSFAVPEQRLEEIRSRMRGGLEVDVVAPGSSRKTATGRLMFVDNAVDQNTGMIRMRGLFQNRDDTLWPGQFVNVSVKLFDQRDALLVPSRSIQTGPGGQYVYVVKPDMTAEVRPVTVERTDGDDSIVGKGLQAGEKVVTQGQLRLVRGAKVAIKS